jgi:hypothetical protein
MSIRERCEECSLDPEWTGVSPEQERHSFACWAAAQMGWYDWLQHVVVEPLLRQAGIPALPASWSYTALEELYDAMWRHRFSWSSEGRAAFGIECYGKHASARIKPNTSSWRVTPKSCTWVPKIADWLHDRDYQGEHRFNGNGGRRYYWPDPDSKPDGTFRIAMSSATGMRLSRGVSHFVVSNVPPLKEDGTQHDWDGYPYFHTVDWRHCDDAGEAVMDSEGPEQTRAWMQAYATVTVEATSMSIGDKLVWHKDCMCAMTEVSQSHCPIHGEGGPEL